MNEEPNSFSSRLSRLERLVELLVTHQLAHEQLQTQQLHISQRGEAALLERDQEHWSMMRDQRAAIYEQGTQLLLSQLAELRAAWVALPPKDGRDE